MFYIKPVLRTERAVFFSFFYISVKNRPTKHTNIIAAETLQNVRLQMFYEYDNRLPGSIKCFTLVMLQPDSSEIP